MGAGYNHPVVQQLLKDTMSAEPSPGLTPTQRPLDIKPGDSPVTYLRFPLLVAYLMWLQI